MKKLNESNAWKIIKQIRKDFLLKHFDPECQQHDKLLSNNLIVENINTLTEKLNVNKRFENETRNLTKKALATAAETFTYLNFCPNKINMFLKNELKFGLPKNILSALNSITKASQNAVRKSSAKEKLQ